MPSLPSRARRQLPELDRALDVEALFRLHNALFSRLCARWTRGHHADAQDLLSEAYLRMVRNSARTHSLPENPVAWLSAIIANLARDYLRAKRRGVCRSNDETDLVETLCDPSYDSDAAFLTRELLNETLHQVQNLSSTQRRALLARSAGEDYDAIAAQLATTPANARKLVQTARSQLRARLSPHELRLIAGKRTERTERTESNHSPQRTSARACA